jgi:hypothetical protein
VQPLWHSYECVQPRPRVSPRPQLLKLTVPRWVLLRDPVGRFDPQALLCTDPAREPLQILTWYVRRWQVEVTFREVRATTSGSRPSASGRTARSTPCLLALFSLVALLAARPLPEHAGRRDRRLVSQVTAAAVRRQFWQQKGFFTSYLTAGRKNLNRHSTKPLPTPSAMPHSTEQIGQSRG